MGSDFCACMAGADVISMAQWKSDHAGERSSKLEDAIFGPPRDLAPFDREYALGKWMDAFEDYARAYELCRLDRHQVAAAVKETTAMGRSAEEQAGWFEMAALRLRHAASFLDEACMKVEFAAGTLQSMA